MKRTRGLDVFNFDAMEFLLKAGVDANAENEHQKSLLYLAVLRIDPSNRM